MKSRFQVAFSPAGSRAVSAAPGEAAVALWDCDAVGGSTRAGALATLAMDHPPVQLAAHAVAGSTKQQFGVVAVCEVRAPQAQLRPQHARWFAGQRFAKHCRERLARQ